jgi:hypothetical protein
MPARLTSTASRVQFVDQIYQESGALCTLVRDLEQMSMLTAQMPLGVSEYSKMALAMSGQKRSMSALQASVFSLQRI